VRAAQTLLITNSSVTAAATILVNYDFTPAVVSTAPEPVTFALLMLGGMAALLRGLFHGEKKENG
jgi:hypothetical protein